MTVSFAVVPFDSSQVGQDDDPRKIGRDLGVGAVLVGRVLPRGDSFTMQTELVDVSSGTQLWGDQYKGKLDDILGLQEEIAQQVSQKLRLRLSGAENNLLRRPLPLAFLDHLQHVSETVALFQFSNYVDAQRLRGVVKFLNR
jgi:hypothetical protein